MIDMSGVIIAKSDQINAADLLGTSRTVKIAGVKLTGKEQATEIKIAGDDKVWRPNKNTVRILARAWGIDGEQWIGRSATLYCDPKVKFGKDEPGGIRISHLSDLRGQLTVCLQERKGVLKTYQIEPLATERANRPSTAPPADAGDSPNASAGAEAGSQQDKAAEWLAGYLASVAACQAPDDLHALRDRSSGALAKLAKSRPELSEQAAAASSARYEALTEEPAPYGEQGDEA